jgi:hypothetical protein
MDKISQPEGDEEILTFDTPDEALERAASAESLAPFRTMVAANRAGKEALKQLLDKLYS